MIVRLNTRTNFYLQNHIFNKKKKVKKMLDKSSNKWINKYIKNNTELPAKKVNLSTVPSMMELDQDLNQRLASVEV